jgi:hypothetical protein
LIRPANDEDKEGFLKLARALGDIPGVWGKDPNSDFVGYLKSVSEGKIIFLLAVFEPASLLLNVLTLKYPYLMICNS